jgi:eukaryotic-like serine/threonine-protein kinase
VQNELSFAVTPIDLLDDTGHVHEEEPDDDGGTRLRQVVSIDPAGPAWPSGAAASPATGQASPWPGGAAVGTTTGAGTRGTRPTSGVGPRGHVSVADPADPTGTAGSARPSWGVAPVEDTVHRAAPAGTTDEERDDEPGDERAPGRRGLWVALSGVLVLVVAVAGVLALVRGGDDGDGQDPDPAPTSDQTFTPSDNLGALVPPVNDLTGTYDAAQGAVVFTWAYDSADAQEGDAFGWKKLDIVADSGIKEVAEPSVAVPAEPGEQVCVEVVVIRDGRFSANPQTACVPEVGQG